MADETGEFIVESSAEITQMLKDRFRAAATIYAIPGLILILLGLILWFVVEVPWYLYGFAVAVGVVLIFYSLVLLSVSVGVPSLRIYEGGVLLKPPKGKTHFHPWSEFTGYDKKKMGELETIELHLKRGDPISISKFIPHYDRIEKLVEENVPPLE